MKKLYLFIVCILSCSASADVRTQNANINLQTKTNLEPALAQAREACSGISDSMEHLKQMAGINTAITAVGTVTGGVALGTGIKKSKIDNTIASEINDSKERYFSKRTGVKGDKISVDASSLATKISSSVEYAFSGSGTMAEQGELDSLTKQSKNLGNARTGTLAVSTATNIAGTAIAATNKVDKDLQTRVEECLVAVKSLNSEYMQARASGSDTDKIEHARQIVEECGKWEYVKLDSINKRGTGAAVSSGIGAGVGLIGTITSLAGNKQNDNTKGLNTASNVMAGGTAVASGVATVMNGTQISAIKKAVEVADKCEEVL